MVIINAAATAKYGPTEYAEQRLFPTLRHRHLFFLMVHWFSYQGPTYNSLVSFLAGNLSPKLKAEHVVLCITISVRSLKNSQ